MEDKVALPVDDYGFGESFDRTIFAKIFRLSSYLIRYGVRSRAPKVNELR